MSMGNIFLIKKPWITEKSTALSNLGKYVFILEPAATKNEVKKAVKDLYRVDVRTVHIIRRAGKPKRFRNVVRTQGSYKKAVVTLVKGQKIDLGR